MFGKLLIVFKLTLKELVFLIVFVYRIPNGIRGIGTNGLQIGRVTNGGASETVGRYHGLPGHPASLDNSNAGSMDAM